MRGGPSYVGRATLISSLYQSLSSVPSRAPYLQSVCLVLNSIVFARRLTDTTGDERPCLRCQKRGCAPSCKDGVRKKAKYLEGTPAEALEQELGSRGRPPVGSSQSFLTRSQPFPELQDPAAGSLYGGQQAGPSSYFAIGGQQGSIPSTPLSATGPGFPNQQTLMPTRYGVGTDQQSLPLSSYPTSLAQSAAISSEPVFTDDLFALAPFDMGHLDNLNFDNRYGAAEFGMLGHMSSGVANSPPGDASAAFGQGSGTYSSTSMLNAYNQSPMEVSHYSYPHSQNRPSWQTDAQQSVKSEPLTSQPSGRHQDSLDGVAKQEALPAFAIGSSAYPSPSSGSSPQGMMGGYEDNPTNNHGYTNKNVSHQAQVRQEQSAHRQTQSGPAPTSATSDSTTKNQTLPSRRHRNPSTVYDSVKQPYSYTQAFHSLTALIQGRFSPQKTAHIAKALAAIRPSFISCTMKLTERDLIFMEKCLQRTLWELENIISATGTPTIICRRTGEVVAVGKEFSYLTGWSKEVLLGKEPNLNVNKGGENSGLPGTGTSPRGGTNTPRVSEPKPGAPVNIVNVLDDDSTCDFFDDYAHLAFGDSRGTVTTPCKLLKYKTAKDMDFADNFDNEVGSRLKRKPNTDSAGTSGIRGESGMIRLGHGIGKVECMLCWSVKRDVFDIPMLVVMNVSCLINRLLGSPLMDVDRSYRAYDILQFLLALHSV